MYRPLLSIATYCKLKLTSLKVRAELPKLRVRARQGYYR
jgi:hypothetical protein